MLYKAFVKPLMEAFQEYKLFKESEIRILALRYRDKIPDKVFDALIKYEVRTYSPYEETLKD